LKRIKIDTLKNDCNEEILKTSMTFYNLLIVAQTASFNIKQKENFGDFLIEK